EGGLPAPVLSRGGVVEHARPRVENGLPAGIGLEREAHARQRPAHALGDLLRRGAECGDVVDAAAQALTRRVGELHQGPDAVGHVHERDARLWPAKRLVRAAAYALDVHVERIVAGPAAWQR